MRRPLTPSRGPGPASASSSQPLAFLHPRPRGCLPSSIFAGSVDSEPRTHIPGHRPGWEARGSGSSEPLKLLSERKRLRTLSLVYGSAAPFMAFYCWAASGFRQCRPLGGATTAGVARDPFPSGPGPGARVRSYGHTRPGPEATLAGQQTHCAVPEATLAGQQTHCALTSPSSSSHRPSALTLRWLQSRADTAGSGAPQGLLMRLCLHQGQTHSKRSERWAGHRALHGV